MFLLGMTGILGEIPYNTSVSHIFGDFERERVTRRFSSVYTRTTHRVGSSNISIQFTRTIGSKPV